MGQQFADAIDRMGVDSCDYVFEPLVRIDIIYFAGSQQAIDHGNALGASLASGKQKVLSAKGHWPNASLYRIVIRI